MCNLGRPFCTSNNLTGAIWEHPFRVSGAGGEDEGFQMGKVF